MSLHCYGLLGGERGPTRIAIAVRCYVPLLAGLVLGMAGAGASAAASPINSGVAGIGSVGAPSERGGAAPLVLPGDAAISRASGGPSRWIVGARPGGVSAAIARRHGGQLLGAGAYVVRRDRARELARDLRRRGALVYAEPDRSAHPAQVPPRDPLSGLTAWRDAVVDPGLAPPPVTARSPLLGLVDSSLDTSHPEFRGSRVITLRAGPVVNSQGTATASVAAAPANGIGILGIWPGMRVVSSPLPGATGTCSQVTRRLRRAVDAGAAVLATGYGFTAVSGGPGSACFSQYVALQEAVRDGVIPVAAAGMTLRTGQALDEPASLPHVITVAAVDGARRPASFSIASRAVDLAAPGVGVFAAVPLTFDRDGTADGYRAVNGTAYPAAMAGAAAAWLVAEDSSLTVDQMAALLRNSAQDLETPGHDVMTGSGLLQVGSALALEPPAPDPREPNEDIPWINGRYLRPAQPPLWYGGRAEKITARLDRFEDPHDVYPVRLPARAAIRVEVRPREGDPSLDAYDQSARTVETRRRRIGRSRTEAQAKETLELRNPTSRSRTVFLDVFVARGTEERAVRYTLKASAHAGR